MSKTTPMDLFPLGIAVGKAHCNRTQERAQLARHVRDGQHTWLWSRRRMGKTSLIEQVGREVRDARRHVVKGHVDLMVVHDFESLETRVRRVVEDTAVALLPGKQRRTEKLKRAFAKLRPEFSVGGEGLRMTLLIPQPDQAAIAEQLIGLDRAAADHNRRVMFVFDEFQQLRDMPDAMGIEGSIRHAVERAKRMTYVFAGSERHLLEQMFESPDRPLYNHCKKMKLERISADAYAEFLSDVAKGRWSKPIREPAIEAIMTLTLRHPYYVNALCAELWAGARPPTADRVEKCWGEIVAAEAGRAAGRIVHLSAAQRGLLAAIAREPNGVAHPNSQAFLGTVRLATSTGLTAQRVLEQEDLIQQGEGGRWILVDPVMAAYLRSA